MNDYHRSKLKSYRAVLGVFDRYPDEVAAVGALSRAAGWVREQVGELEAAVKAQTDYAPKGSAKDGLREDLATAAVPVAQAIAAKADEDGDAATADQFDFVRSDFLRGPEQDALDRASLTLDEARGAEADLLDYGIDAAALDALEAALGAFDEALSAPRDAIVARRAHTKTIERLVPAIEARLRKRVDRMMTRHDGTPFGDEYRTARTVVDE